MITSIDRKKCTGCGTCVKSCTLDVFSLDTDQEGLAPCMFHCPCGVDIRGVVYLMQQDRLEEALSLLKEAQPFPALSGRLCAHCCEQGCLRGEKAGVNIFGLERYLGDLDLALDEKQEPIRHLAPAAVVGASLAGLACAWFLRKAGYRVTVYESAACAGGGLWNLPGPGMSRQVLERQLEKIRQTGVKFRFHTKIGPSGDLKWIELLRRGYRAFCLAGGKDSALAFSPVLQTDSTGRLEVDALTGQTSDRRVFAAGSVAGADSLESAIATARHAAMSMDRFLRGADLMSNRLPGPGLAEPLPPVSSVAPRTRGGRGTGSKAWTTPGMSLEEVQIESLRCLTCGAKARLAHTDDCMTCFTCEMKCPAGAITVHPFKEILPRSLDRLERGV